MRGGGLSVGATLVALLAACGPAPSVHRVRSGETLATIARAYGVSQYELARLNGLRDPDRLRAGRLLRLPAVTRRASPRLRRGSGGWAAAFAWPVEGAVVGSPFGPRWGRQHDGIDLGAPEGTPVRAARDGRVIFSGWRRGYGKVVVVDHGGGWTTLYAHNRENLVRTGAAVRRGAVIATLGASGTTSGPNLHFEIRKDGVAYDPVWYLPPTDGPRPAFTRHTGDSDP